MHLKDSDAMEQLSFHMNFGDKFEDLDKKYQYDEQMLFYIYEVREEICCWQSIREEIVKNKALSTTVPRTVVHNPYDS
mgnify:FL=1